MAPDEPARLRFCLWADKSQTGYERLHRNSGSEVWHVRQRDLNPSRSAWSPKFERAWTIYARPGTGRWRGL